MEIKEIILKEIELIPEKYLPYILEYILSVEEGKISAEKIGTALASESSLSKDWLNSEEDTAWKDL